AGFRPGRCAKRKVPYHSDGATIRRPFADVFRRTRIPFVGHIVFSLHFYTLLLVLFCVALAVVGASLLTGGAGLNSEAFDHLLSAIELAVSGVYLFVAVGTVYRAR